MPRLPFIEESLSVVRRGVLLALGVDVLALAVYSVAGAALVASEAIALPYPVLVLEDDPVLALLASAAGLYTSVAMGAQVVLAVLSPAPPLRTLLVVGGSSVALGLGAATFYHSFRLLAAMAGTRPGVQPRAG